MTSSSSRTGATGAPDSTGENAVPDTTPVAKSLSKGGIILGCFLWTLSSYLTWQTVEKLDDLVGNFVGIAFGLYVTITGLWIIVTRSYGNGLSSREARYAAGWLLSGVMLFRASTSRAEFCGLVASNNTNDEDTVENTVMSKRKAIGLAVFLIIGGLVFAAWQVVGLIAFAVLVIATFYAAAMFIEFILMQGWNGLTRGEMFAVFAGPFGLAFTLFTMWRAGRRTTTAPAPAPNLS